MKKNKVFHFAVYGHCIGRQEPQKGRHGWFTPPKTKKYYEHIRNSFQQLYPRLNDRTHKWKVRLTIYVYGKKFPDNTNVAKGFEDALEGCIWHNDNQIWDGPYPIRHPTEAKKGEYVDVYAEMGEEIK